MDDPRQPQPGNDQGPFTSDVQQMTYPQGTGYGFSMLDDQMQPCFRFIFPTARDAEHGRKLMEQIMDYAIWYDPEAAPSPEPGHFLPRL